MCFCLLARTGMPNCSDKNMELAPDRSPVLQNATMRIAWVSLVPNATPVFGEFCLGNVISVVWSLSSEWQRLFAYPISGASARGGSRQVGMWKVEVQLNNFKINECMHESRTFVTVYVVDLMHVRVCMCNNICLCTCVYTCVLLRVIMFVCMHVCMCVHAHVHLCTWLFACICF